MIRGFRMGRKLGKYFRHWSRWCDILDVRMPTDLKLPVSERRELFLLKSIEMEP